MKWLVKQIEDLAGLPLSFLETVDLKSSLMKRESDIIDVSPLEIKGTFTYIEHSIIANFTITGVVTLPSSRSLEPVEWPMTIDVNERYVEEMYLMQYAQELKNEVIVPIIGAHIDLSESIVDSILLNLPIQVLSQEEVEANELPSGKGWMLYTEDAYNMQKQKEAEETVDPRFASLKDLFSGDNEPSDATKRQ